MAKDILGTIGQEFNVNRLKRSQFVVNLGLIFNIFLAGAKLSAGILGHSRALLADGVNSASDVVYYIVIKIFVRMSGKPADHEHPYGHHQFESIAALIVGAFIITTGIAIFWDSVNAVFDFFSKAVSEKPIQSFSLWISVSTVVIKIFLMIHSSIIGNKIKNPAITALSQDHRNDIFASLGATIGIIFGLIGFPWVDPVAGAVVAILVTKTGIEILRSSSSELMDAVPDELIEAEIKKSLSEFKDIKKVEEIHAHRFGPYLVVNLTICVDGNLSVREGDRIASDVEKKLLKEIEMLKKVYVHYHPLADNI